MIPECHHIKTSGGKCGSPALRGQLYCYFHSAPPCETRTSQPHAGLAAYLPKEIGNLEDRGAIQLAVTKVAKAVAENRIEPRRAGLILYALQIASGNAKKRLQRPSPSQPKLLIPAILRLSSIESAMDCLYRQLKPLKANGFPTEMGGPYHDALKSLTRPPISR